MAIESFLKVDERDPDWTYSPNHYFGKQFKVIDANCLMIKEGTDERVPEEVRLRHGIAIVSHMSVVVVHQLIT